MEHRIGEHMSVENACLWGMDDGVVAGRAI